MFPGQIITNSCLLKNGSIAVPVWDSSGCSSTGCMRSYPLPLTMPRPHNEMSSSTLTVQERKPSTRASTGASSINSPSGRPLQPSRLGAKKLYSQGEAQKGRHTCPGVELSQEGLSLVTWAGKACPQTILTDMLRRPLAEWMKTPGEVLQSKVTGTSCLRLMVFPIRWSPVHKAPIHPPSP